MLLTRPTTMGIDPPKYQLVAALLLKDGVEEVSVVVVASLTLFHAGNEATTRIESHLPSDYYQIVNYLRRCSRELSPDAAQL